MAFTLRSPISENPHLREEAPVLSRHVSLRAAQKALRRQQVDAERQGLLCEAYVWDETRRCLATGLNVNWPAE